MPQTRVRFAPSPTGLQHLGGMRTALFNWLIAKQTGGRFILRFEDTDRERLVPEAITHTQASLRWLGLDWQEGPEVGGPHTPYIQSQRLKIYREYAELLIKKGRMYRDWTTPEQLEQLRGKAKALKMPFVIRQHMLNTQGDPTTPHVIRFKIDDQLNPKWHDLVRGELTQKGSDLDDFIAIKSDGFPTYNFANVVDDYLMEISHVIRGEEFIASTPKFLQVYEAFGWQPPTFAHLPPVLGPDKTKLSKRHGAEDVLYYQRQGYLPEAIINFLALLGWHPGTEEEVIPADQLLKSFKLERVHKSPAVFDMERLNWFNGVYIRQLKLGELATRGEEFWPEEAKGFEKTYRKQVLKLVQERLKYLAELPELTDFFFTDPKIDKQLLAKSKVNQGQLEQTKEVLTASDFSEADLERRLRQLTGELKVKPGQLFGAIRLAVTGQTAAPGLFETLAVIGKPRTLSRLDRAIEIL